MFMTLFAFIHFSSLALLSLCTHGEVMVCLMGQQPDPNRGYEIHWVLQYTREELCQCSKVLFGGVNLDVPEEVENHFYPEEPLLFINNLEEIKKSLLGCEGECEFVVS